MKRQTANPSSRSPGMICRERSVRAASAKNRCGVLSLRKIAPVLLMAALSCIPNSAQNDRQVQRTVQRPQPAAQQTAQPSFTSFSPTQGAAGSTVTITFNGANFVARSFSLSFSPSQGITVSSLTVTSSTQITAQLQIAANAQLGNRQASLVDADHDLRITTPFTITAAAQNNCPPGMLAPAACATTQNAVPALRGFTPVQGTQGTMVALTFTGTNLDRRPPCSSRPTAGLRFCPLR